VIVHPLVTAYDAAGTELDAHRLAPFHFDDLAAMIELTVRDLVHAQPNTARVSIDLGIPNEWRTSRQTCARKDRTVSAV
jgi:hypothetical protein